MKGILAKIPVWAYTIVLIVLGAVSNIFTMQSASSYFASFGYGQGILVVAIIFAGIMYGFFMRLLARLVYGLGDRLFFRTMSFVPDYNLRRVPIPYNDFIRTTMFWLCVASLVGALFNSLFTYVFPLGVYLWRWLSRLAIVACLAIAYFQMDKAHVPAWQSGKCFLCLMVPTAVR